jgi:hypothetical protein
MPPLRLLDGNDFSCMDEMAKSVAEKRGGRGKHNEKRRPSRKAHSDIKCLCDGIEKKGREAGVNVDDRTSGREGKPWP